MQKPCRQCASQFEITEDDLKFYDKVSPVFERKKYAIPAPTLCPDCRQQRRLSWRGERKLYHRSCGLCKKPIISIFCPEEPYTVYCRDCWWSDKWNPLDFGQDFDFGKPFFEQYAQLLKKVPLLASYNIDPFNSEYNNNASYLKNCYLMTSSNVNEDCYYGYYNNDSKDCIDCTSIKRSELCYECVECIDCYNCRYCRNSSKCSDSWFLENCAACKNCFGCVNLRQKEYCYFNQQLTKHDYERKMAEFHSGDRKVLEALTKQMEKHRLSYPFPFMIGDRNENVSGNCVFQSQNSDNCYDCIQVQDCKHCFQMQEAKDCQDVMSWGRTGELFYECMATGANGYNNQFVVINTGGINNLYSYMCMNSKNIFGCIAVKKDTFCILNKKYSEKEYGEIVTKIMEHMGGTPSAQLPLRRHVDSIARRREGAASERERSEGGLGLAGPKPTAKNKEWGEFFPTWLSPFAYNESLVNDFYPLSRKDAEKIGGKWKEEDVTNRYKGPIVNIPDSIGDVPEDITKKILSCAKCGNNYKIIDQEIAFYRKHQLPVPLLCHQCRHKHRLTLKNPRKLWDRKCAKCHAEIKTSYAPDRPETVYCEKCYLEAVY